MTEVLHVPYTYFPDPSGGTEVYVRNLAQRLCVRGFPSTIAAPARVPAQYEHDGLPVHRFAVDDRPRLDLAYGIPDEIAADGFRAVVARTKPRIVHLHARTSAVSERLADIARAAGALVVLTYHTPTMSCARGTMMLNGEEPCDGVIEARRCSACALSANGVSSLVAHGVAWLPRRMTEALAQAGGRARPVSALRIPSLIAEGGTRFRRFASKADHIVAVCQWVRLVLERNGVPAEKITLSRQGITAKPSLQRRPERSAADSALRLAYFGRLDRTKGADLLVEAMRLEPDAPITIDLYAVRQPGSEDEAAWIERAAGRDRRLRLLDAVAPDDVAEVMAGYDLIAVPSRWLETGPLVVLEAFAAGVPVLGARLGGIAELVRDGVDGILVAPDDAAAWADCLQRIAADRSIARALASRIEPPRSIDACVDDMAALYATLLSARNDQNRPRHLAS